MASSPTAERARLAAYVRSAKYDGREVTAKARATFRASFRTGHECKVCPLVTLPADLTETERDRRADALHQAHYLRIRLARGKRSATRKAADASETPPAAEPEVQGHARPAA